MKERNFFHLLYEFKKKIMHKIYDMLRIFKNSFNSFIKCLAKTIGTPSLILKNRINI